MPAIQKKDLPLLIGFGLSIALLVVFLVLQARSSPVLDLNSRWLIVTGVPVLVALIAGGYIKSFKGLGIELETRLNTPVESVGLKETASHPIMEYVAETYGFDKGGMSQLGSLTDTERNEVTRLRFIGGRENFYAEGAIANYVSNFPKLQYFEVADSRGRFECLLPIEALSAGGQNNGDVALDDTKLGQFVFALGQNQVQSEFATSALTGSVSHRTGIVEALKTMRKGRMRKAAVTGEDGTFVGLVLASAIEKQIADDVLNTKSGG